MIRIDYLGDVGDPTPAPTLFDFTEVTYDTSQSLYERFLAFHKANPSVYAELKRLAMILKRRGHTKIGIAMLYEQMRWQWYAQTTDVSGFKLSNNHRAYYARLLMTQEPELAGFFTTRETSS